MANKQMDIRAIVHMFRFQVHALEQDASEVLRLVRSWRNRFDPIHPSTPPATSQSASQPSILRPIESREGSLQTELVPKVLDDKGKEESEGRLQMDVTRNKEVEVTKEGVLVNKQEKNKVTAARDSKPQSGTVSSGEDSDSDSGAESIEDLSRSEGGQTETQLFSVSKLHFTSYPLKF